MKKFFAEFKEFINRGNVIDMAVGVMIGAAFKGIVDSLVNDIISPIIGLIAHEDFSALSIRLLGVEFKYGAFLMAILNFFIIATVLFIIVKMMNNLHKIGKKKQLEEEAPAEPTTKVCPYCRSEIAIEATRCPHCTSEL